MVHVHVSMIELLLLLPETHDSTKVGIWEWDSRVGVLVDALSLESCCFVCCFLLKM